MKDLVPALEEHWLGFHHSLEPEAARRYLSAGVIRDGTLTSDEIRHFIETRARFQEVVDTCYSTPGLETEKQILQRYLDNFMERLHPMDWRLWKSIEVIEPYLDQVPTETLLNDIEPFMDDAMKYRYQLRTIMNG